MDTITIHKKKGTDQEHPIAADQVGLDADISESHVDQAGLIASTSALSPPKPGKNLKKRGGWKLSADEREYAKRAFTTFIKEAKKQHGGRSKAGAWFPPTQCAR